MEKFPEILNEIDIFQFYIFPHRPTLGSVATEDIKQQPVESGNRHYHRHFTCAVSRHGVSNSLTITSAGSMQFHTIPSSQVPQPTQEVHMNGSWGTWLHNTIQYIEQHDKMMNIWKGNLAKRTVALYAPFSLSPLISSFNTSLALNLYIAQVLQVLWPSVEERHKLRLHQLQIWIQLPWGRGKKVNPIKN